MKMTSILNMRAQNSDFGNVFKFDWDWPWILFSIQNVLRIQLTGWVFIPQAKYQIQLLFDNIVSILTQNYRDWLYVWTLSLWVPCLCLRHWA